MTAKKTFQVAGVSQTLSSTPLTIGGIEYDIPAINLEAYLVATSDVIPVLRNGNTRAIYEAYLTTVATRMASVDGSPLTEEFMRMYCASGDEIEAFSKSARRWLIDSGFLVELKEGLPGEGQPAAGQPVPAKNESAT